MASVRLEAQGPVALVTLDRPPVNSLVRNTYLELKQVFDSLGEIPGIRVAVLRAEGRFFCPGNDVAEFVSVSGASEVTAYAETVSAGISSVYACKVPVVAAVHGHALGAGMALAACADVIVASDDSEFGIPEIKVGVIGASGFLALLVPEKVVRYMSLTGRPISARQVMGYGGVHAVVPSDEVFDAAMDIARDIAGNAPVGVRYFKEAMNINQDARLEQKYATESAYTARYIDSDEARESVAAFLERRSPDYD